MNGADILGDDGKAVAKESIGMSYDAENARFSPLNLKSGDWPQGAEQVVIDAGTARKEHYKVGDDVVIATAGKQRTYEITGTAGYGDVDSLGFGSIAVWDLETAATVLDREGRYDAIQIAAKSGTSPAELVDAVAAAGRRQAPGQGQRQAGRGGRGQAQRGHEHDPHVPARLRRHRAAGRRVRDLQHPVDHGRPAHAGVRDAADPRRLAQAGHALGQAGGPRASAWSPR